MSNPNSGCGCPPPSCEVKCPVPPMMRSRCPPLQLPEVHCPCPQPLPADITKYMGQDKDKCCPEPKCNKALPLPHGTIPVAGKQHKQRASYSSPAVSQLPISLLRKGLNGVKSQEDNKKQQTPGKKIS